MTSTASAVLVFYFKKYAKQKPVGYTGFAFLELGDQPDRELGYRTELGETQGRLLSEARKDSVNR